MHLALPILTLLATLTAAAPPRLTTRGDDAGVALIAQLRGYPFVSARNRWQVSKRQAAR